MAVITVIGAGMMGSAIAIPAEANGNEIRLVGTPLDTQIIDYARDVGEHLTLKRSLPASFQFFQNSELGSALSGTDIVVGGVSSFGVEWFSEEVIPRLPLGMPVLSVTKGMYLLDTGELITFPDYYERKHPNCGIPFCAVGGPCTSYELADEDQTEVCFCGRDAKLLADLRQLFETWYYHVSTSTDVTGVEIAVAMKNAYALAVCLAIGMSQVRNEDHHENYNSQAALFGQSIREISRLLAIYGGAPGNIVYAAGDLYVTIFGGRTRRIGKLLGQGMPIGDALDTLKGVTLESVVIAKRTAKAVRRLISAGKADGREFPLMLHVDEILHGEQVSIPWNAFETYAQ